jgi:chromate transport protein ChrA
MTLTWIREMLDLAVFITAFCSSLLLSGVWYPLWIIPATCFLYWLLFVPLISDSAFGYMVHSCRYDQWVHGKNEWGRLQK